MLQGSSFVTLNDEDSYVRQGAAWALGEIKDLRAIGPLIFAIKDKDLDVRLRAAKALVKIGTPAVEPLIEALKDKDSYVRGNAAWGLRAITGQDFGGDPAKWQEWWEKNKKETRTGR